MLPLFLHHKRDRTECNQQSQRQECYGSCIASRWGTRETSAQWAVDEVKVTRVSQPKQTRPFLQKGLV